MSRFFVHDERRLVRIQEHNAPQGWREVTEKEWDDFRAETRKLTPAKRKKIHAGKAAPK